jgi:hypothetical protein
MNFKNNEEMDEEIVNSYASVVYTRNEDNA